MQIAAIDALKRAPLFADMNAEELRQIAGLFKARRIDKGETIVKEGLGGAAFYVIETGEALVTIRGQARATLKPGNFFGEIALFDEGTRTATITATTEMVCYGLTYWDFRPLVEGNGVIGWKLLQRMAQIVRDIRGE